MLVRLLASASFALAGMMTFPCQAWAQEITGPLIDVEWLAHRMGNPSVLILQAEMRRESYEEGHIPGARFLDMTRFVWDGEPAWGTELQFSTAGWLVGSPQVERSQLRSRQWLVGAP